MKDEAMKETTRNLHESGKHQVPPSTRGNSRERSENVSTTVYMPTKPNPNYEDRENRENAFPEVLAKYKKMLEKIANQTIPDKTRTQTKQRASLLKKEEADKFRQQFDHVRRIRPDKWVTSQWKSIEHSHEQLVELACRVTEVDRIAQISHQMNVIIEDLLRQMEAIGSYSTSY